MHFNYAVRTIELKLN